MHKIPKISYFLLFCVPKQHRHYWNTYRTPKQHLFGGQPRTAQCRPYVRLGWSRLVLERAGRCRINKISWCVGDRPRGMGGVLRWNEVKLRKTGTKRTKMKGGGLGLLVVIVLGAALADEDPERDVLTEEEEGVVEEDMSLYTRLIPTFSSTPRVRVAISVTLLDHTFF